MNKRKRAAGKQLLAWLLTVLMLTSMCLPVMATDTIGQDIPTEADGQTDAKAAHAGDSQLIDEALQEAEDVQLTEPDPSDELQDASLTQDAGQVSEDTEALTETDPDDAGFADPAEDAENGNQDDQSPEDVQEEDAAKTDSDETDTRPVDLYPSSADVLRALADADSYIHASVAALKTSYYPGDTAQIRVTVKNDTDLDIVNPEGDQAFDLSVYTDSAALANVLQMQSEEDLAAEAATEAEVSEAVEETAEAEESETVEETADTEESETVEETADTEESETVEETAEAEEPVAVEEAAETEVPAAAEETADTEESETVEETAETEEAASLEELVPAQTGASTTLYYIGEKEFPEKGEVLKKGEEIELVFNVKISELAEPLEGDLWVAFSVSKELEEDFAAETFETQIGMPAITTPIKVEQAPVREVKKVKAAPTLLQAAASGAPKGLLGSGGSNVVPIRQPQAGTPLSIEFSPEYHKQIEYLGTDGDASTRDLYRLYLDLTTQPEAIDLMLVLDYSGSMTKAMGSSTRIDTLENFLNGTDGEPGFIKTFLNANDDNRIAAVKFASNASEMFGWTDDAEEISDKPVGATNYAAALTVADELFDEVENDGKTHILLFLSDGMPTYAYYDGQLHNNEDRYRVGSGSQMSTSLNVALYQVLDAILDGSGTADFGVSIEGDQAIFSGDDYVVDTFPVFYMMRDTDISGIPGYDREAGEITDADAFIDFLDNQLYFEVDEVEWVHAHSTNIDYDTLPQYDLYELCKDAFNQFISQNEDVACYTIGFSDELDETPDNALTDYNGATRYNDEVLRYMAGAAPAGEYYFAGDAGGLANALNSVLYMKGVTITDTLSQYVDPAAETQIKVTMETPSSDPNEDPAYEILYKELSGAEPLVDANAIESVEIVEDPQTHVQKLVATFKEDYTLNPLSTYTVSFNVNVNDDAYTEYENNGYNATGDADTDHGTNDTSSGKEGFYSNDSAKASWNGGSAEYPFPVVQIRKQGGVKITKLDHATMQPLTGAVFAIYEDAGVAGTYEEDVDTTPAVVFKDKKNTELADNPAVVTNEDGTLTLYGLDPDPAKTYWIVETQAPKGYAALTKPAKLSFKDRTTGILNGEEVTLTTEGLCEMTFENSKVGNLPKAGASGVFRFELIGLIVAVLGCGVLAMIKVRKTNGGKLL